jgi:hypothetical protein
LKVKTRVPFALLRSGRSPYAHRTIQQWNVKNLKHTVSNLEDRIYISNRKELTSSRWVTCDLKFFGPGGALASNTKRIRNGNIGTLGGSQVLTMNKRWIEACEEEQLQEKTKHLLLQWSLTRKDRLRWKILSNINLEAEPAHLFGLSLGHVCTGFSTIQQDLYMVRRANFKVFSLHLVFACREEI